MRLNYFQMEVLLQANRHASVMEILDRTGNEIFPLSKAINSDGFNWSSIRIVGYELKAVKIPSEMGEIFSATRGGSPHGDIQLAAESEAGLYVTATTSGGHWVELKFFKDGHVAVACDGRLSERNWGDCHKVDKAVDLERNRWLMTEPERRLCRANDILEEACREYDGQLKSSTRGMLKARQGLMLKSAKMFGSASMKM